MLLHNMKNNRIKSIFSQNLGDTDLNHRSNDISCQQRHFYKQIGYLTELDNDELAMENRRVEDFFLTDFSSSLNPNGEFLSRGF